MGYNRVLPGKPDHRVTPSFSFSYCFFNPGRPGPGSGFKTMSETYQSSDYDITDIIKNISTGQV